MNKERKILTVDDFLEARPDMISFNSNSIQSAINQAESLLDSETNGLMLQVWNYNKLDSTFGQDEEGLRLRRNEWELGQIVQAVISQTQYTLNLGNDFSVGSESFSIGGVNGSFQRPEGRELIAPGVIKLLQNARVYKLSNYSNGFTCEVVDNDIQINYDKDCITYNIGDKRYLSTYQPNVKVGNVAYVNDSQMVDFGNPQDLNITTYSTKKILDTQTNNYVEIDKVKDLCFFGKNLYGYKSGVERGEIFNLLSLVNMNWSEEYEYRKDTLLTYAYVEGGKWYVQDFLAKRDNKGANPLTSPDDWERLGTVEMDINHIVDLTYNRVVEKYNGDFESLTNEINTLFTNLQASFEGKFNDLENNINTNFNKLSDNFNSEVETLKTTIIPNEITTQLNALPTIEYINTIFVKGQCALFETKELANEFIAKYSLVEGEDYKITTQKYPIGIGDNGALIENKLTVENLPTNDFTLTTPYKINQYYTPNTKWDNSFSYMNYTQRQDLTFKLNKGTQTNNISSYIERYEIVFLRDIVEVKKGAIKYEE